MKRKRDSKKGKHPQKPRGEDKAGSTPSSDKKKEHDLGKNRGLISRCFWKLFNVFCKQKNQETLVDEEVVTPEASLNQRILTLGRKTSDEETKTTQGQKTPYLPDQMPAKMEEKSAPASASQTSDQISKNTKNPSVMKDSSQQNQYTLVRSQIFFNLSIGRLFSNINKLFVKIGYRLKDEYYKYAEDCDKHSLYLLLDNISGLLSELQLIQESSRFKVIVHRDEELFKTWADKLKKLKRRQKESESLVLTLVEKILQNFKLDKNLSTSIEPFDSTLESRIIDELSKEQQETEDPLDSQKRLLQLNNKTQDLAIQYEKAIQSFLGTPIEQIPFEKTPLVWIDLQKL